LSVSFSTRVDVCCIAPASSSSSSFLRIIITIYTYYTGCTQLLSYCTYVRTHRRLRVRAQRKPFALPTPHHTHARARTVCPLTSPGTGSGAHNVFIFLLRPREEGIIFRFNRLRSYPSGANVRRWCSGISLLNSVAGTYSYKPLPARCRASCTEFRFRGSACGETMFLALQ